MTPGIVSLQTENMGLKSKWNLKLQGHLLFPPKRRSLGNPASGFKDWTVKTMMKQEEDEDDLSLEDDYDDDKISTKKIMMIIIWTWSSSW